ncbi:hypothetical protein PKCBPO_00187 [Methylorubrum thiocyanatum]
MIELRPALVPGEAPLRLGFRKRARRDMPVAPLLRSAVLAAILAAVGLPVLCGPAIDLSPGLDPAPLQATGRAAPHTSGTRVALVREASR